MPSRSLTHQSGHHLEDGERKDIWKWYPIKKDRQAAGNTPARAPGWQKRHGWCWGQEGRAHPHFCMTQQYSHCCPLTCPSTPSLMDNTSTLQRQRKVNGCLVRGQNLHDKCSSVLLPKRQRLVWAMNHWDFLSLGRNFSWHVKDALNDDRAEQGNIQATG